MNTLLAIIMAVACAGTPTTTPTTRPSNIPKIMADLRAQIAGLQFHLDTVLKENADLRRQIAMLEAKINATTQPAPTQDERITAAVKAHQLALGMTIDQVSEIYKMPHEITRSEFMRRGQTVKTERWLGTLGVDVRTMEFENGILVSLDYWPTR